MYVDNLKPLVGWTGKLGIFEDIVTMFRFIVLLDKPNYIIIYLLKIETTSKTKLCYIVQCIA